jgi:hypothetical protein
MKWVRFAKDFAPGGPLHYLLKNGDELVPDPEGRHSPPDPNILVSKLRDPDISNNFRIYDLEEGKFETTYLDDKATFRDRGVFHRWDYEIELPSTYKERISADSKYHYFELYAGGWIEFWDKEIRHGGTDHALYFKLISRGPGRYATAYILQTRVHVGWNFYLSIASPPTSTDPPPVKSGKPPG